MPNGFTLIELLIALAVITVGIAGAFIAIQQGIMAIDYSHARLTAALLAQEGVEIIKNIRDTNLLEYNRGSTGTAWSQGLAAGDFEVQHTDTHFLDPTLSEPACSPSCDYDDLTFLKKDDHDFYNYTTGSDTRFKRKIHIVSIDPDQMDLEITVYWVKRGGGHHELILRQYIRNWLNI